MKLKHKLLLVLGIAGLIPALLVAVLGLFNASGALHEASTSKLEALREARKGEVVRYLDSISQQAASLSRNPEILDASLALNSAFESERMAGGNEAKQSLSQSYQQQFLARYKTLNPNANTTGLDERIVSQLSPSAINLQARYIVQNPHALGEKHLFDQSDAGTEYDRIHAGLHPYLRDFLERFGFYDVFLVDARTADVVYSVFKEVDFATSLSKGPFRDSGLARAYEKAIQLRPGDAPVFEDFSRYTPSYEAPAAFVAVPVFDGGNAVSVLIFQFPLGKLNTIMTERAGMGETGETYLVGSDHLMRSDSYLDPDEFSVEASFRHPEKRRIDTNAVTKALNGESGSGEMLDYLGHPVVGAWAPLQVNGLAWAILAEVDVTEAFAPIDSLQVQVGTVLLVTLVAVLALAVLVSESVLRPLGGEPKEMEAVVDQVSRGDLTHHFEESSDVSGVYKAMRRMSRNLRGVVEEISDAACQQAAAAHELAAITTQTTTNVDRQHQNTDMVVTAMHEMSASVAEVSSNTSAAAEAARSARDKVLQGANEVEASANDVREVSLSLMNTRDRIVCLRQSAKDISGILNTIRDIADQTNLLALNAAIEAARAGEQGRGFAVVADEVRGLAQNTQDATKNIETMIDTLQKESQQSTEAVEQTAERAGMLSERASATSSRLADAVVAVEHIADMSIQIAAATEQQSAVSEEILKNAEEISRMSVETGTAVEQISRSSEELASLSATMQGLVQKFRL